MNITPIAPRKLTFPTKASTKPSEAQSSSIPRQDTFVPSDAPQKSLKSSLIGAGVGALLGSFAYGVVGKGTTPLPRFIPFNRSLAVSATNTIASVKTIMCSTGLGLGAATLGPAFGVDPLQGSGVLGGVLTGMAGGVVLGVGGSLLHSMLGIPPLAAGAIVGGTMGFLAS